jgi:UDP-N-acetylglucosamine 3-dehydrogenase
MNDTRTVALVGCGAIAESFYLPFLKKHRPADSVILVDSDEARAQKVAAKFGLHRTTRNYASALRDACGVILAVPHRLHYSMALQALDFGVHVLVEKPLTPIAEEATGLAVLASRMGLKLIVNNTRRLFPSYIEIRRLIESEVLGAPLSIDWAEGDQFQWPTASGFYFQTSNQPRGVLLDLGAHAMDALCWWLGCPPEVVQCESDSFGGPEATAHVSSRAGGCEITLRLSWLTKQRNTILIRFEHGAVEAGVWDWNALTLSSEKGDKKHMVVGNYASYSDFAAPLLSNYLDIVDGKDSLPIIPGEHVLPSLNVLDVCYEKMRRFSLPWYPRPSPPLAQANVAQRQGNL